MTTVDITDFRAAMTRFPSGVTVTTTLDDWDQPRGFTANAFCSVSLDPPLVLVCLAHTADCLTAFRACRHFVISVLRHDQDDLALRFATKGADKFAGPGFHRTSRGLLAVSDAVCVLECALHDQHPAGDHTILLGRVEHAQVTDGDPLVYHAREFSRLPPTDWLAG